MGYTYDFEYQVEEFFTNELSSIADKIFIVMGIIVFAALFIALASWIMRSIALTRLGKRRGIAAPWLVWLPLVGCWTIGALADDYDARLGIKRRWRVVLLVCSILATALYSSSCTSGVANLVEAAYDIEHGAAYSVMDDIAETFLLFYGSAIISALISMIFYVCNYICLYKVYESTLPRQSVLCFVLSLMVPLAEPICLLIAMNKGYPEKDEPEALLSEAAPEARNWYVN